MSSTSTDNAEPPHADVDDGEPVKVEVVVGRIGRAHGVRGEVSVLVLTDDPDRRFGPGSRLRVEAARRHRFDAAARSLGELTVQAVRHHHDRLLVTFEQLGERSAAEALAGSHLIATVEADEATDEDDTWFDHQLTGLRVLLPDGTEVGTVARLDHGAAQDLLVVAGRHGGQALVPFVSAIVPDVDVAGGAITIDPPGGLLDDLHPPLD